MERQPMETTALGISDVCVERKTMERQPMETMALGISDVCVERKDHGVGAASTIRTKHDHSSVGYLEGYFAGDIRLRGEKRSGKAAWIFSILFVVTVIVAFGQQMYFHYQFSNLKHQVAELGGKGGKKMQASSDSKSHKVPFRGSAMQQVSSWTQEVQRVQDYYSEMAQWNPQPMWISNFGPTSKIQGITLTDIKESFISEKRHPWVLIGSLAETADQTFDFWPLGDFVKKLGEAWKNPDQVYCIIISVPQMLKDWLRVHEIRKKPPCAKFKHSLPLLFTALVVPPGTPGGRLKPFDAMARQLDFMLNTSRGAPSFVEKLIVSEETSMVDLSECLLRLDQSYSVWPYKMPNPGTPKLIDPEEIVKDRDKNPVIKNAKNIVSRTVAMVGKINWKVQTPIKLKKKNKDEFIKILNDANRTKDDLNAANNSKTSPIIVLMRFDRDFIGNATEAFLQMEEQENVLNDLHDVIVTDCYYISLVLPDATDENEKRFIKSNFRQMIREIDAASGPLVRVTWADVDSNYYDNIETLRRFADLITDLKDFTKKKYLKFAVKVLLSVAGTVATNSGMPGGQMVGNVAQGTNRVV